MSTDKVVHLHLKADKTHVPECLRIPKAMPAVSDMLVIDARLPITPLVQMLAQGGYTLINMLDGRLVLTRWPGDFRP